MRQWTIDAFAAAPFRGNPACVVEPYDTWPDAAWMQALASENNQAETAFLLKTGDPARFGLRWFTPKLEVPLCGHATLASAHCLFAELGLAASQVAFDTKSGRLTVQAVENGYEMDFPAQPPVRTEIPAGLAEALGARPTEVWAGPYLVAVMANEAAVRGLTPDLAALEKVSSGATGGRGNVSVCAVADPDQPYGVVSRFFAPGSGIPEDAATGSAHCMLSPLFAGLKGGAKLHFFQAYPGRGADLWCTLRGDRVAIEGAAMTVAEAVLRL